MRPQHVGFILSLVIYGFFPKGCEEPKLVIRHFAIISLSRFIVIMSILCLMHKPKVGVYFN